jgi:hypothetical protein
VQAGATYDSGYNGLTISGRKFTDTVVVSGNNITIENCLVENGGLNTFGFYVTGSNVTIRNCTVRPQVGTSYYCAISLTDSDGAQVIGCDISGGENNIAASSTNTLVDMCYIHDPSIASDPAGHPDGFELFTLSNFTISRCRILHLGYIDGAINLSPFGTTGSDSDGLYVYDNFIDGGQEHLLIDNQAADGTELNNIRVLRNVMGGHTDVGTFGRYNPLLDHDNRGTVETLLEQQADPTAIVWPTSGPDANHWGECSDLTPDKTGQIVLP